MPNLRAWALKHCKYLRPFFHHIMNLLLTFWKALLPNHTKKVLACHSLQNLLWLCKSQSHVPPQPDFAEEMSKRSIFRWFCLRVSQGFCRSSPGKQTDTFQANLKHVKERRTLFRSTSNVFEHIRGLLLVRLAATTNWAASLSLSYYKTLESAYFCYKSCCVKALAPGGSTELNASALEAIAEEAPSARLPRDQVISALLSEIMATVKLQASKSASRRLIQVKLPSHT